MNIPYGKQQITNDDIKEVVRVLQSDFLTQGPEIEIFEKGFAERVNAPHAIAVSNGTAALHMCALALGVEPGQRVITTPITFAASANCIAYCGGTLEFCDIDSNTYLIDLDKLEAMLYSKPKGYYTGVIPVDFGGLMVNMQRVRSLADEYGLWIIEDACHAPGAYFVDDEGNMHFAGQGDFADCAIFSFHPVKHIACGEGGMVTTASDKLAGRLQLLRTHGITKLPDLLTRNDGGWYYEMQELGYNYRLTDFQAALGTKQLQKLDASLENRNRIAAAYKKELADLPVSYQALPEGYYNAHHLFVIRTEKRKELFDFLRGNNIFVQVHYIPVHLMPYYKQFGWKESDMPEAEAYYGQCLSLPMFPTLKAEEFDFVIEKLREFFDA